MCWGLCAFLAERGGGILFFYAIVPAAPWGSGHQPGSSGNKKTACPAAGIKKEITLDESADHSVRQGLFLFYLSI